MTAYGAFAALYDRLMDDVDYEAWARHYAALIHLAPNMRVADMACGTGEIALRLGRMGARVTVQDMRVYAPPRRAEAVVCACDGVNYRRTRSDVDRCFAAVFAALRPGGVFAFALSGRRSCAAWPGRCTARTGRT